ncbi:MAG TPA: beta-ketoacyl-ACP synthase III [Rickettsiales bacterium]|nr:beta-ketoacyl-ACP synthase III [Rickettsiales bacterium]
MTNTKIIGTGSYLPEKVMINADLEKLVETTNEWIVERTGIEERRIAADNELTSDLALKASLEAIKSSGIEKNNIDVVIVATTTPDRTFPSTATILQNKLGISDNCFAFDVQAVCGGFVYALTVANSFIKSGQVKTALVVAAETISRIIDWKDRNTCVLFGDGAGAVIVQATEENSGILNCDLHSDGQYGDLLKTSGGVSLNQQSGFVQMEGKEIFKLATTKMVESVLENLKKCGLDISNLNLLIPHQANKRIIDATARKLNLTDEQVIVTIQKQANTSAATIPLALDYAVKNNRIKKDDIVLLEALGGGLVWGSIIIKW